MRKVMMMRSLMPARRWLLVLVQVREMHAAEHPYCFEIFSANRKSYLLQAEGPHEFQGWIMAIRYGRDTGTPGWRSLDAVRDDEYIPFFALSCHVHRATPASC
jgi:hypothetical protein